MRSSAKSRWFSVILLIAAPVAAQEAPIPVVGELPGRPFAIQKKWVIGGAGNWDYLTLDPAARRLYVTHQTQIQVIDLSGGGVAGVVSGFGDARQVVLDPNGQSAYVSDARANVVRIFDRGTFQITGEIGLPSSPRALVYEPGTGLLVAFGSMPTATSRRPSPMEESRGTQRPSPPPCGGGHWGVPVYQSVISLIDPQKSRRVADLEVCGILGAAQADGLGRVYFAITNQHAIGRLDLAALAALINTNVPGKLETVHGTKLDNGIVHLDLREGTNYRPSPGHGSAGIHEFDRFGLPNDCEATSLAVDGPHAQLFAGCANQSLEIANTDTGASVASFIIGPGVDTVAYDDNRGLIFTANGGGYGSLSIIRRHQTDSYAVIQNLPTMERARTMAIDPSTGLVYLVTDLHGVKLDHPPFNGIGTLKLDPVEGSFQVLVIGN